MIDSYAAATLVRSAPLTVRESLCSRWGDMGSIPAGSNRSFLQTASQVGGRSRGRAGLHLVKFTLARYNTRVYNGNDPSVRAFFDNVEHDLLILELNTRGSMRKNGYLIKRFSFVSYMENGLLCVGKVLNVYAGSRRAAPYDPGCSLCVLRRNPPANSTVIMRDAVDCGMRIVRKASFGPLDYVCSTRLLHRYIQVYWPLPTDDGLVALVRMEEL